MEHRGVRAMKALQVTAHGRPGEVLAVREIDRPEPEAGEVRVKVAAASLNFNDIDRCRGNLVSVPTPPPFTLGMDVCGIVDAAGEGAEPWLGKRVVAITKTALGGIAEYAIAPAVSVFDAPESSTTWRAPRSSSPSRPRTWPSSAGGAWPGETLVVHSAASGLGTAGIQLGKAAGARVIAVAGGPQKGALCTSLGADLVIDHTTEDFVEVVLGATATGRRGGLRPHRGRLRGALVALHGPRGALPGRRLRRRRRQRHDGSPAAHGMHRQHRHRVVMVAWAESVDPGMRRFGFNPFGRDVADEVHTDLLRLAAARSDPPLRGRRVTMEEAGASARRP